MWRVSLQSKQEEEATKLMESTDEAHGVFSHPNYFSFLIYVCIYTCNVHLGRNSQD